MSVEGVDYAFPPFPSPSALVAAGKHFACRYGGPGSDSKQLHASERDALFGAGLGIVANAEGAADGLLGGYSAGVSWARSALDHFGALGLPASRPIYLSADFDMTSGQWSTVANGLRGAASVLGLSRVGVYGGYNAMVWARRDGVARWFWQTYAWSGGRWAAGNHIEQYKIGATIGGADCDLNRAMVPDFGQWTGDDDMAFMDDKDFAALAFRVEALVSGRDTVIGGPTKGERVQTWNKIAATLATNQQFLDAMKNQLTGDVIVDGAPLGDADKPAIVEAVKQALREGAV
ncbi:MAG: DUF1906 domain-containing protein [Catenulispora sp.]|nr:DUF1906 domain-containing protein [Catenulispora sp.]